MISMHNSTSERNGLGCSFNSSLLDKANAQRLAALNSQGENDDDSDGWSEESHVSVIDREPAAEAEAKESPGQLDVQPQMSHVAAMLTNLLANRNRPSKLQSSKLYGDPDRSPSDTRGHSESSAEQESIGADDWEHGHGHGHGSRSGSSTSRYSHFGHDLASHDEEDCDEGSDENAVMQRVMPSYSDGECFQDDELSAIEYEDSDYHGNNQYNDYEDGMLDENTHSGRSVASSSKHYRGPGSASVSGSASRSRAGSRSGYSVTEEPYQCNSDGIFYRDERLPRSPSYTVSTGSTYLHCKERDRQLLAQMMELTTSSVRKTPIKKVPFSVKALQHPKRTCMVDVVLLSSRPCYGSPVRTAKSPNTIDLHDGSRPKFRHTPGFSIKNSKEEIYTRASLTLPRGKSKKTARLICDDAPFQASDIYSSGQFGYLSKSRVSGHATGERDEESTKSKVQDSLRKELIRSKQEKDRILMLVVDLIGEEQLSQFLQRHEHSSNVMDLLGETFGSRG